MHARIRRSLRLVLCLCFVAALPRATRADDGPTPAEALQRMQIGHARYLCGKSDRPNCDAAARERNFSHGQHPFAAVLSCADSRAPVEMLFDQGIGDLFVIRVAGAVSDKQQLGSLEYAFEHLHVPLLVVMGHRGCGAVGASMSSVDPPGNLGSIVRCIRPAVELAEKQNPSLRGDALLAEAVKLNVLQTMRDILTGSPIIAELVQKGKIKVVGAVYDIETGTLNWIGQHPGESEFVGGAAAKATPEDAKSEPKTAERAPDEKQVHSAEHASGAKPPPAGTEAKRTTTSAAPTPALPRAKSEKPGESGHDH